MRKGIWCAFLNRRNDRSRSPICVRNGFIDMAGVLVASFPRVKPTYLKYNLPLLPTFPTVKCFPSRPLGAISGTLSGILFDRFVERCHSISALFFTRKSDCARSFPRRPRFNFDVLGPWATVWARRRPDCPSLAFPPVVVDERPSIAPS